MKLRHREKHGFMHGLIKFDFNRNNNNTNRTKRKRWPGMNLKSIYNPRRQKFSFTEKCPKYFVSRGNKLKNLLDSMFQLKPFHFLLDLMK